MCNRPQCARNPGSDVHVGDLVCHCPDCGCTTASWAAAPRWKRRPWPERPTFFDACRGICGGWDVHSIPTSAAGRSGPAIPCGKAKRRAGTGASRPWSAMPDSPTARWSGNGSSSASKRRSTPFRDGLLAGSDRSGGADGDVHRHPARCRSRHAEAGGRSQPRPRWPDRHRRSGGRGTTASAPATYGTGGVSIADAISCPATPEAPCTLVDRHRYGRPALKTGPPTDGSNATTGRTLEVETPSGYAFASATTMWRTRPPIRGR